MSEPDKLLPATYHALAISLGTTIPDAAHANGMEAIRRFLIGEITRLLDRNPSYLMHVLYRVDVDERKVKRVFAESSAAELPGDLADLLIERQLVKQAIRERYRQAGHQTLSNE